MKRILILILTTILLCSCTPYVQQPDTQPTQTQITVNSTSEQTVPSLNTESSVSTQPEDSVITLLNSMSLEQKVGQLFLARCPDINAIADIEKYYLGGYILFARDFEDQTPESIKTTVQNYQKAANIPMLIAVDEEGGIVNRVSKYKAFRSEPFPSSRSVYLQGGITYIESNETEKCQLLSSLGINVNVAPVCDVTTDPKAFMYSRSLGQSPQVTGEFVSAVVGIMKSYRMGGILKHFPGYGNNTDTHVAIAVDNRPLSELESVDLVPFAQGIKAGAEAIMVSHVYINAIDPHTPATLSPAVHDYLRSKMGFDGVIVTDDLVMKAITDTYGVGESAVLAVLAGNDLLCVTDYAEQYNAVVQAVKNGRITEELLNSAVLRILRWKQNLGLIS